MGANVSKSATKQRNEILTEVVQNNLQSSSQDVKNLFGSTQINDFEFGTVSGACNISLFNKSDIKQLFKGSIDSQQLNSMENDLQSKLAQSYSAKVDQANSMGFGANITTSKTDIYNAVKTSIAGNFSQNNVQNVVQSIFTVQNNKLKINNLVCTGTAKDGTIVQAINASTASQIAAPIIKTLQKNITENKTLSEIDSKYDSSVSQKNSIIGALIALGVVILIALIAYAFVKKNPMKPNNFKNNKIA